MQQNQTKNQIESRSDQHHKREHSEGIGYYISDVNL